MDVVCTAGHVDHGKSTLVRALTGMEPDRFEEERRRGLTIDIGFGWAALQADGRARTVAFVDLPGHERFIANMLAGAGPVETALFVVAADEGWKPQSSEHLQILDLLGVRHGVVAISKLDAADDDQLARTRSQVEAHLEGTALEGAPVVPVSAKDAKGLDTLRATLLEVLDGKPAPRANALPRLWVDRSFTIKGAGTVVTGTLTGGALRVGDAVTVLPSQRRGRVRGMQSLRSAVEQAEAGDRVAVNLSGIGREELQRGDLVTTAEAAAVTSTLDVFLRTVADGRVGRRGAWHLHAGAGEWVAQVRPLLAGAIEDTGFARVILDRPAPLLPGDRFVLRDAGRQATVAGGVVLDGQPLVMRGTAQRQRRASQLAARDEALRSGDDARLLRLHVDERGAIAAGEAAAVVSLPEAGLPVLAAEAGLLPLGAGWADPQAATAWTAAVLRALQEYHDAHPDERAAPRAVVTTAAQRAGCPPAAVADLLTTLVRLRRVVTEGAGLRHPDHGVRLSPEQQQSRQALLQSLDAEPFAPPRLSEAAAAAGASRTLVRELEAAGDLIRLADDLAMTRAAIAQATDVVRRLADDVGPFTASQAKEALSTSRKYALPLLEELDRRGITARNGDVRRLT